jgi:hypothetical protein
MGVLKQAHNFVANNAEFVDESHHIHAATQTGERYIYGLYKANLEI